MKGCRTLNFSMCLWRCVCVCVICQPGSVQSCLNRDVLESKTVKESIERQWWAWLDAYSPTGSANWDKEVSWGKCHNFSKTFSLCREFINLQNVQRQKRKWERLVENDSWSSGIIQRLSCCTNTLVSKLAARDKQTNYTNGPRRSEKFVSFSVWVPQASWPRFITFSLMTVLPCPVLLSCDWPVPVLQRRLSFLD